MWQQGHTKEWKSGDYVADVEKYLGKKVDFILINNEPPTKEQVERYKLEEGSGVLVEDSLTDPRVIRASLISPVIWNYEKTDERQKYRAFIRHDGEKLAKVIEEIIKK